MGAMLLIAFLLIFVLVLLVVLLILARKCACVQRAYQALKKMLLYNWFLRYVL